ncbi:MAG TPA: phosphatase [Syntrophomonas sp.]|jgi:exopolyphosphatase/guanosine-5'-triphosphate,3'-diphosphate pyrophosphatase|nr:phosphatase [Syntrophomonas sp.]
MRYAAIDVGSNSCRLLVADVNQGKLQTVFRELQSTRLGEGVNASKKINSAAMARTLDCIHDYLNLIQRLGIKEFRMIATSAMRDALNREEFVNLVKENCGCTLEVISGEEEAQLSYLGVKEGLNLSSPLVIDLGGGSCEFRIEDGEELFSLSLPLGAVRVTEAHLSTVEAKNILSPLENYQLKLKDYPLVFVGGTATTLVAMKLSMEIYDPQQVHGQILSRGEVADLYNMLELMPLNVRCRLPGLQPERADIIPAGAMIVLLIMDTLKRQQITISESDILDGIIHRLSQKRHSEEL